MKNSLSRYRASSSATLSAAAATLLVTSTAQAELIIHTPDPILQFGPSRTVSFSLGIFDGTNTPGYGKDLTISSGCSGAWNIFKSGSEYDLSFAVESGIRNFNIGETVDSSVTWNDGYGSLRTTGNQYIGFRATSGEDSYYGWVQVDVEISGSQYEFAVAAWAYESEPGVGAAVVPEPSVSAALMGVAVLGLLSVRKFMGRKSR